MENRCNQNRR